ncbi:MAG: ATP-binding protein [Alphaproteobacteria bacterium]|nr:ATP-binding protein [Alphaproteobacteria bacterium]
MSEAASDSAQAANAGQIDGGGFSWPAAILRWLQATRLSARAGSQRLGLAPDTLGKIINGHVVAPSPKTARALASRAGIAPPEADATKADPPSPRGALLAMPVADRLNALWREEFQGSGARSAPQSFLLTKTQSLALQEAFFKADTDAAAGKAARLRRKRIDIGVRFATRAPVVEAGKIRGGFELGPWRVAINRGLGAESCAYVAIVDRPGRETAADVVATREALVALVDHLEGRRRRRWSKKPPLRGCWDVAESGGAFGFARAGKINPEEAQRYRSLPFYERIERDMHAFFASLEEYDAMNQIAFRKVAMTGSPGTGKTSIAKAIMERFAPRIPCFTIGSFDQLMYFLQSFAAVKRPAIVYGEEVDILMGGGTSALSVLDGIDTPPVRGVYALFSTNFPERIDPRIRERPGRIDMFWNVEPMKGDEVLHVLLTTMLPALGKALDDASRTLLAAKLSHMTVAELKDVVLRAKMSARLAGRKTICIDDLVAARQALVEAIRQGQSFKLSRHHGKMGRLDADGKLEVVESFNPIDRAREADDDAKAAERQIEIQKEAGTGGEVAPGTPPENPWSRVGAPKDDAPV